MRKTECNSEIKDAYVYINVCVLKSIIQGTWCGVKDSRSPIEGLSMADHSRIEWTEAIWNPVAGCSILSPGCTNCYAMRMAARLAVMGQEKYAGTTRKTGGRYKWNGVVKIDPSSSMRRVGGKKAGGYS